MAKDIGKTLDGENEPESIPLYEKVSVEAERENNSYFHELFAGLFVLFERDD